MYKDKIRSRLAPTDISYYLLSKLCDIHHLATTLARYVQLLEQLRNLTPSCSFGYQGPIQFCTCILLLVS